MTTKVAGCLLVVVVSLLVVGVVSGTVLRHTIQVAPGVILLAFFRPRSWAPYAAMAVFVFWLLIMALIWCTLLGIADVVSGTFTPIEVGLTIAIGLASVLGLMAVFRRGGTAPLAARIVAFLIAAVLQFGAVWLSVQPSFANR